MKKKTFSFIFLILSAFLVALLWRSIKPLPESTLSEPYNFASYRQVKPFPYSDEFALRSGATLAKSYELHSLDGAKPILQSLHADAPLVIEFGSLSCPIFRNNSQEMDQLWQDFKEQFNFVTIYTREAHPGFLIPEHNTLEEKLAAAKGLQMKGLQRPLLVDALDGALHRHVSPYPNAAAILDTDGQLLYLSYWNVPSKLREALEEIAKAKVKPTKVYHNICKIPLHLKKAELKKLTFRIATTSGPDALLDFALNAVRKFKNSEQEKKLSKQCRTDIVWKALTSKNRASN